MAGERRPEASIVEATRKLLRRRHAWWQKTQHGSSKGVAGPGRRGVSDLHICYRGIFISAEMKAAGNHATQSQLLELESVAAAGGIAIVARHEDEVERFLDLIDRAYDESVPVYDLPFIHDEAARTRLPEWKYHWRRLGQKVGPLADREELLS